MRSSWINDRSYFTGDSKVSTRVMEASQWDRYEKWYQLQRSKRSWSLHDCDEEFFICNVMFWWDGVRVQDANISGEAWVPYSEVCLNLFLACYSNFSCHVYKIVCLPVKPMLFFLCFHLNMNFYSVPLYLKHVWHGSKLLSVWHFRRARRYLKNLCRWSLNLWWQPC
jgi:hypothetical protein